jgi:hypothetical protein
MRVNLTILFFAIWWSNSIAQVGLNKPLPPTFEVLTLNPLSGVPTLEWTPPVFNPLYPNPTGYIIYMPLPGGGWEPIASVGPSVTSYTDNSNSGKSSSIQYTLASSGPTEPSQLTQPHGSIYLTVEYDSCLNKLNLSWNHYLGWFNRIEEYVIYMGTDTRWVYFEPVKTISGNLNHTSIYNIPSDQKFYVFIHAKKKADTEIISRSNLVEISTKVARKPDFMIIDSILAYDQFTEIHFLIDSATEYRKFSLVRWENPDSVLSIFTAKTLGFFYDHLTKVFKDTSDSWTARSKAFYFKINGFDGCNKLHVVSGITNSVTQRVVNRGLRNTITWDPLYTAKGNPVQYKVYRITYKDFKNPPEVIFNAIDPFNYSYIDDVSQLEGQGITTQICYYVEAIELDDNLPVTLSRSRTFCTEVIPDVVMPNAIDPLSQIISPQSTGGNQRNFFAPTISFKANYKLIIYNRWGGVVYDGSNSGWDGRLANGEYAKEGAYVYRLEVYTESKRSITKTGTLTVIYGPSQ